MEMIQSSPRVVCLSLFCDRAVPKGCVPLGIYGVEETKGLIDGMRIVGLQGVTTSMAIMRALKAMKCTQCHVTPHGKLHGLIWESQETQWKLTVPMERPTR